MAFPLSCVISLFYFDSIFTLKDDKGLVGIWEDFL